MIFIDTKCKICLDTKEDVSINNSESISDILCENCNNKSLERLWSGRSFFIDREKTNPDEIYTVELEYRDENGKKCRQSMDKSIMHHIFNSGK